jgi:hypothetical protein
LLLGLGQLRRIPEGKTTELQNRAARVITVDTYDIRSKDILKKLNWKNLSGKRKEKASAYVSKAITGNCSKNIAEKFKISNSERYDLKDMIPS